jgi:type IV pilus assembly protein PilB
MDVETSEDKGMAVGGDRGTATAGGANDSATPSGDGAQQPRAAERAPPAVHWSAVVYGPDGRELNAQVEDISATGACLCFLDAVDGDAAAIQGGEITIAIQTGERRINRCAEVRWVMAANGVMRAGLRFRDHTELRDASYRLHCADLRVDPACALRVPAHIAFRRKVLPFAEVDGVIHVACAEDPAHSSHLAALESQWDKPVRYWQVGEDEIQALLLRVHGNQAQALAQAQSASAAQAGRRPGAADPNNAAAFSDDLLYAAFLRQASDVHIDPGTGGVTVRFRVDGHLEIFDQLPAGVAPEVVSRFKVLAGMDIAEKRAPQDGRFSHQFMIGGRRVDVRVATLPTKYGERMTMRLLALDTAALTLERLGLATHHEETLRHFLRRSQGMMLLTGPTGSGKTTTLYAGIRMLIAERALNIMTVEDPIEYEIDGVAQCEVDNAEKVTFAKALRSILRHDPDVVMIGEIRDEETADIAMKAALTGHLVLGTLHTNSAPAAITRLFDMGVQPYLVAASLRLAVAQRLFRRLCPYCRVPRALSMREAAALGRPELAGQRIFEPGGCVYCAGRGYAGRVGIYEMLSMRAEWARDIAAGRGESEIIAHMRQDGIPFLLDDALAKLLEGNAEIGEVLQIAASW